MTEGVFMSKDNNKINELIIDEAVKKFKNGEIKNSMDVENFIDSLLQPLMQKLLDTELENHLEYSKYERGKNNTNNRNGYCKSKRVETKYGSIEVKTPRDRNGEFEPTIIEKRQTKLTGFEDKCILLYAKGMSLRDIENVLKEIYGVNINKDEITRLISSVNEEVDKFKKRPLQPLYLFTYADCLYVPIKDDNLTSQKKAIYVIIGVDVNGYKDILGIWIDKTESASFWSCVFDDLKQRGVEDILYMSSDGIAGFQGSLEIAFPKTQSQRCVVHLTRNIYRLCPKKEANKIIKAWKNIYTCPSKEAAEILLEDFKQEFKKYETVVKKVTEFMIYLEPLYELPEEIRYAIYTSNSVEAVNSALRKVTRGKGAFPSEESVYKVLYLRIKDLKEKWDKNPIKNFKIIQKQLIEIFGQRYTKYLNEIN